MRTLPRMASALLRYFGTQDEGAVGDLLEEFESGKSGAWYWRQVASLVVAAALRDIRARPIAFAVCLLVGWFVTWQVATTGVRFTIDAAYRSYSRWYFAQGGLPPPPIAPFTWVLNFAINVSANACGGFAAVRCYRGHRPLMALMFATAIAVQQVALMVWFSTTFDATTVPAHYVFDPIPARVVAASLAVPSIGALLGGMFGARRLVTGAA